MIRELVACPKSQREQVMMLKFKSGQFISRVLAPCSCLLLPWLSSVDVRCLTSSLLTQRLHKRSQMNLEKLLRAYSLFSPYTLCDSSHSDSALKPLNHLPSGSLRVRLSAHTVYLAFLIVFSFLNMDQALIPSSPHSLPFLFLKTVYLLRFMYLFER